MGKRIFLTCDKRIKHYLCCSMEKERLFFDYGTFLSEHFQGKVQKLSVDGGFGCPNRDGTIGWGGCNFCNNRSFVPSYCSPDDSISSQLEKGKRFFSRKYLEMQYLAYFQARTNTYAPLDKLRHCYEEALSVDGIVGLVIGTRPDCLPNELLDYLSELSKSVYVLLELGIESTDDGQLQKMNRGHTFAQTVDAVERASLRGIMTAGHVILGLPGDTRETLLNQPAQLNALPLKILKLHQLQIIRDTALAHAYADTPEQFSMLFNTAEGYADFVCEYVERLRPDLVLERFTSQTQADLLVAPRWGLKNYEFVDLLRKRMTERGTYQGRLYHFHI